MPVVPLLVRVELADARLVEAHVRPALAWPVHAQPLFKLGGEMVATVRAELVDAVDASLGLLLVSEDLMGTSVCVCGRGGGGIKGGAG